MITVLAEVADPKDVDAVADRAASELGGINAWVNNAMSTVIARAGAITPEEYQRATATTYLSQVYGTLAALRHMRSAGHGTIVQISSDLAIRSAPLQAAYCGAKAAVTGFTDSLRSELIDETSPIALSVVYLPGVNTPQPGWSHNRLGAGDPRSPFRSSALPGSGMVDSRGSETRSLGWTDHRNDGAGSAYRARLLRL